MSIFAAPQTCHCVGSGDGWERAAGAEERIPAQISSSTAFTIWGQIEAIRILRKKNLGVRNFELADFPKANSFLQRCWDKYKDKTPHVFMNLLFVNTLQREHCTFQTETVRVAIIVLSLLLTIVCCYFAGTVWNKCTTSLCKWNTIRSLCRIAQSRECSREDLVTSNVLSLLASLRWLSATHHWSHSRDHI